MGVTDQGAREARYAEAMRRSPNGPWMTLPGPTDIAPSFVRAVLPLVDAEVAAAVSEAQAEAANLRMQHEASQGALSDLLTEHRALVEGVEAAIELAERITPNGSPEWVESGIAMRATVLREFRALLSASPAATTGEAKGDLCDGCRSWTCVHNGCRNRPAPVSSGEAAIGEVVQS